MNQSNEPDKFNQIVTLQGELYAVVKKMVEYRRLYVGKAAELQHTELWLEGYRRLAREKGFHDFDRLLDILKEIENEDAR